jgi:hypothetical protein
MSERERPSVGKPRFLTAMSRATFDLTIADRLRRMAAELQDKAAEQA